MALCSIKYSNLFHIGSKSRHIRTLKCFVGNNHDKLKSKENDTEQRVEKVHELNSLLKTTKPELKVKPLPKVDLKSTRGITVKHVNAETRNSAIIRQCIELQPDKDGFFQAIDVWTKNNKTRRGHMDFIATAMKFIEPYKLGDDVEVYTKLMNVFPRGRFENRTLFDAVWPKAHPQINLALDLLTKMEEHHIIPDQALHDVIYEIFGRASFPLQKLNRMYFWFNEVKDLNPYELPAEIYKDQLNVIKAAAERICDDQNKGTEVLEISDAVADDEGNLSYEHYIVSCQTAKQRDYFKLCTPESVCLYVEGPYFIWVNRAMERYFVLKTGRQQLKTFEWTKITEDEEREGVVLSTCFASAPYKDNLQRWLTHLLAENPVLKDLNVVFDIKEDEDDNNSEQSQQPTLEITN